MRKPFLSIKKVRQWFLQNSPGEVLKAKLGDGTTTIVVSDDGVEQEVYLSFDEETDGEVVEMEVEIIDDLRFRATIEDKRDDGEVRGTFVREFTQPEKDAWIVWKEV